VSYPYPTAWGQSSLLTAGGCGIWDLGGMTSYVTTCLGCVASLASVTVAILHASIHRSEMHGVFSNDSAYLKVWVQCEST
jgi:hypothetical protein